MNFWALSSKLKYYFRRDNRWTVKFGITGKLFLNYVRGLLRFFISHSEATSARLQVMDITEIGKITEKTEKIQFEWEIEDFFSVAEKLDHFASPTFSFIEKAWYLKLWTNVTTETNKGMHLFLVSDVKRDFSVEYHFGLKKCNGSVKKIESGILKKKAKCSAAHILIGMPELQRRKSTLMLSNSLIIICTLNLVTENSDSTITFVPEKTVPSELKKLDKLSENFKNLLDDKESCDVTLKIKDKEFRAHRSILMARSSVLAANFKHDMLENQTGVIIIEDCDPDSFGEFLEYLYCGKLQLLSIPNAINLYYTSNKYDVEEIRTFCTEYILQCLDIETICDIALFADKYDEIQLSSEVKKFFIKNSLKILLTSEWECLMKSNYRLANKLLTEMVKLKLKG